MAGGLLYLVHDVTAIHITGDVFRRDCTDFVRRIALLTHLFEEMLVADYADSSLTSLDSYIWYSDLVLALLAAKKVILLAADFRYNASSDGAAKKITFQFQCATWKLYEALGNIPYDVLVISEEVLEQAELVRAQLRRAMEKYGFSDSKVVLHTENVVSIDNEVYESERLDGVGEGRDNAAQKSLEEHKKSDSDAIPVDYLCPISLELMKDPVIVATGQTYEWSSIQRWIDCGNLTCPKTQQILENLTLTPNYVLRSLITQWCTEHNVELLMGLENGKMKKSDGSFCDVTGDKAAIEALVLGLSSRSIEERRASASEIRSLSKRSTDNRLLIAKAGAIPALVNLLTTEDMLTQENAVTSILNLSIYEDNKGLIMIADAIPSIVQVLRAGSMEARENAAATLFSLSLVGENKVTIGASGAIPALVELLQNGSTRGKKDAATVLIDLLRTGLPRNKENAAAILLSLCKRDIENLASISRLGAVIPLTELATSSTGRANRKATSLLDHLRKLH